MNHRDTLTRTKFDDHEVASRRAFFEITDEDLARVASLRPLAQKHAAAIVDRFYELLLGHPETRKFFPDDDTVRRVKRTQSVYFLGLFGGRLDRAYVDDRLRVGATHERIGLGPQWYLGACRKYLHILVDVFLEELPESEARLAFLSIQKIIYFDMSIAIDTYILAQVETIRRHQAAIRELSTPVIRVYDRVLLLPLVGTVDSLRAEQIMEAALLGITEEQAQVLILDIAGVAVVDTKVADHLIKTTAAVRLLGAQTILTGISAQVARTIVQLGVDITSMHTKNRLADGIELALTMIGRGITAKQT